MSGFQKAMQDAMKNDTKEEKKVESQDSKTTENKEAPTPEAKTEKEQTDSKEPVAAKKIEKKDNEDLSSGVQKRFNKMTYKNKQLEEQLTDNNTKLAEALAKIDELSKPKAKKATVEEEGTPEFEEVGDLIKYMNDNIQQLVKEGVTAELSKVSNNMLETDKKSKVDTMVNDFRESLVSESGLFDDGDFAGAEEQRQMLLKADELFASNPGFYSNLVKEKGVPFLLDLVGGNLGNKQKDIDDLIKASDDSETLKASADNVAELPFKKGISFREAATQFVRKNK